MRRPYLTPGWILAHIVVAALAVAFVLLGLWQLNRLDDLRAENARGEERYSGDPVSVQDAEAMSGESLEFQRVIAAGVFDPASEVLIRSQVYQGNAGFHVITPLVAENGDGVLVNRGWVPLALDDVPATNAQPPEGVVLVEGWAQLTQERPAIGPEDPTDGHLEYLSRVDVERIEQQVSYPLASFYLVEIGEQGSELPVPLAEPAFSDAGPHLSYAIQWFGFAGILVVGWVFLVRRQTARAKPSTTS